MEFVSVSEAWHGREVAVHSVRRSRFARYRHLSGRGLAVFHSLPPIRLTRINWIILSYGSFSFRVLLSSRLLPS